jgi:hypothetical protein
MIEIGMFDIVYALLYESEESIRISTSSSSCMMTSPNNY